MAPDINKFPIPETARLLNRAANFWLIGTVVLIVAYLLSAALESDEFMSGFAVALSNFAPDHVVDYLLMLLVLAPALGLKTWAYRVRSRQRRLHRRAQS